jgi:ribosome-binding protein aMBF1 (putative translation factor)
MIENELQFRVTKSRVTAFKKAVADLEQNPPKLPPKGVKARREAMLSEIEVLETQLAEYQTLKGSRRVVLELEALRNLPEALLQARIAAGLTQAELAKRLGVKVQQVQRDEKMRYAGASLERVIHVAEVLGV